MSKDRMDREERKQLRAPDEFITTTTHAVEWAQANSRTVVVAVAGIVAVLLGLGFFSSYQRAQHREANADLTAGLNAYRGGDFSAAATDLDTVAGRWSGSEIGPLAKVLAANSQLNAANPDAAIESLNNLAAAQLTPYLRQQLEVTWANALEAKADWAAAAAKYAGAAAIGGPYTGDALMAEARVRARNGETDKAEALYRRVLTEFPDRSDRQFLEAKTS